MSVLRARYLVQLARWNMPPPVVDGLNLWDFEQLTAAIDAEARAAQQQGGR